jgi:hypothetical protein
VTNPLPTNRKFTGQLSAEVGLYFYNARWVDVKLGRFLKGDSSSDKRAPPLDKALLRRKLQQGLPGLAIDR